MIGKQNQTPGPRPKNGAELMEPARAQSPHKKRGGQPLRTSPAKKEVGGKTKTGATVPGGESLEEKGENDPPRS